MSEVKSACYNDGCRCENSCGSGFGGWEILIILVVIFCFCGGGFGSLFGGCCNN